MNPIFASLPVDMNTLIVIVIAIVSGISSWLEKKRKADAAEKARNRSKPAETTAREAEPEQPNMEEILRRLLGGEPSPSASPPPLARSEQETGPMEPRQLENTPEPPPDISWREELPAPSAPMPPVLAPVVNRSAMPVQTAAPPAVKPPVKDWVLPGKSAGAALPGIVKRMQTQEAQQTALRLRKRQTAREAFIASLVFGPPKSLENSQP